MSAIDDLLKRNAGEAEVLHYVDLQNMVNAARAELAAKDAVILAAQEVVNTNGHLDSLRWPLMVKKIEAMAAALQELK